MSTERKNPLGSSAVVKALKEQKQIREDALIASTKSIYQDIEPSNDNSQLNKYLFPPYTNDKKGMA